MMSSISDWGARGSSALRAGVAAALIALAGTASAQTTSDFAEVDGVTIYLAVLPAEMLRGFPSGSEESRMHGGVPRGKHIHHVQVALFDTQTGDRIDGAQVTATVAEIGLGGVTKTLQPFTIGDALTYGQYFEFEKRLHFDVNIRATLPGGKRVVETTFDYEHL